MALGRYKKLNFFKLLLFFIFSFQGKRVLGEDGEEQVNDMYHENIMLQTEVNNLRTRTKAMQETIDDLTKKNCQLLALKASGNFVYPIK